MPQVFPPVATGSRFNLNASPVAGIDPVFDWTLFAYEEHDNDGFLTTGYFARGPKRDVDLDVSRFRFTPSQERFAWLVRNGFPKRPRFGPWDDTDIEGHLVAEREALAA